MQRGFGCDSLGTEYSGFRSASLRHVTEGMNAVLSHASVVIVFWDY